MTAPNPFLALQKNADERPKGIFARTADVIVTNEEAVVGAKKIAYELRRLGVKAGDIVALDLPERLSILFTEAVYHEGGISTVIPDGYSSEGVFRVSWMFTNRSSTPQPGAQVVQVDQRFLQRVEENPYGISPSAEPIDTLRIVFTSGTTGRPHAIALGRAMEAAIDEQGESTFQKGTTLVLMDTGSPWGFGEFYLSVKAGKPFLSVGGGTPRDVVEVAAQNSVTAISGSPFQMLALVEELEAQGRTLPSVQMAVVAGTVMPPGVADRLRRVTGGCLIFGNYGSTEAGGATARLYESDDPWDAGHVIPGSVVEVVDEDDQVVPAGVVASIRHRSSGMVDGYLGEPEASAKAFRDGWFYSGDLGFFRPDGGLTLTGRESEVLNAGGVKIDPARLDHVALQQPKVVDACSFEYTAASGLRQVGMALVTEDDVDVQAVIAALTAEFGTAAPKLVARVDEIPRNSFGKPMRRTLAEKYREA